MPVFAVTALAVPGEVVDGLQDLLPLLLVAPLPQVPPALLRSGRVVRVQNHALGGRFNSDVSAVPATRAFLTLSSFSIGQPMKNISIVDHYMNKWQRVQ